EVLDLKEIPKTIVIVGGGVIGLEMASYFNSGITVAEAENGTVSVDKTTAAEGDTVTITAKAADGYEVDTITVTGASGDVDVAEDGTFKMPAEAVTVTATFKAVESDKPTDDNPTDDKPTDDNPTDDNPTDDNPADDKPTSGEAVTYDPVVPDTTVSFVPANSAKKFEITDPVTGKTISTSVNKLAKALSKLTEGSDLTFDTGSFGIVLRKNVIKEIVDNDLTLVVKTSKATFIIDAENLAKVKTINIPAIMKTSNFKKLVKEGNTFNVIVTEKNKVEIELV
ncbi:MAG: hypothetical protein J6A05_06810, partial [Oscillospiraceae bacterium]|nr:hypothetical protein [Oscillospiraceae bacterium]